MYISDFFYIWKTNRMMLFCNLFIERPSYMSKCNTDNGKTAIVDKIKHHEKHNQAKNLKQTTNDK